MNRKLWLTCLGIIVLAVAMAFAACGDDDDATPTPSPEPTPDPAEVQEIVDVMTTLVTTDGADATEAEIDFYAGHITDAFLQDFGTESIEACLADTETCIGEPLPAPSIDPATVEIDGDAATLTLGSEIGEFGIDLIKENDVWKANSIFVPNDDIGDADVLELGVLEFAFEGDLDSDAVKSGDFAIHVKNDGLQTHEVVLVPLPAEGELEDILQDETFEPEPIFVKFPFAPGDEANVALPAPLDPGRYAFVCFFPDTDDPERTPHAFKGMARDFNVE